MSTELLHTGFDGIAQDIYRRKNRASRVTEHPATRLDVADVFSGLCRNDANIGHSRSPFDDLGISAQIHPCYLWSNMHGLDHSVG